MAEEDWKGALRNNAVLLVSAGEEHVGLKREVGRYAEFGMSFSTLSTPLPPTEGHGEER